MKIIIKEKIKLLYVVILLLLIIVCQFNFLLEAQSTGTSGQQTGTSQTSSQASQKTQTPTEFTYGFFSFSKNYDALKSGATNNGYKFTEKEINSIFGKFLLIFEKQYQTYNESVYIFFNEKKEPIFIKITYTLMTKTTRSFLEKLFLEVKKVLHEKYGPTQREDLPYYRNYNDKYEIILSPLFAASISFDLQVKFNDKYIAYIDYYNKEVSKTQDAEISTIIKQY
ncbi:MAG: hypothetical protein N3A58_05310 [Spirochaetes bacterium]|nr:hypothetical protein [Spirochaetota bacterium]